MLIIDLMVIWRAWVLFQDQRWVILPPFILWIGAVGEWTFSRKSFPCAESLLSPRDDRRMLRIIVDHHGPYAHVNKPSDKYFIHHKPVALRRNQRRHDIADCIQIMVCPCRPDSLDPTADHEVILQEPPHIPRENSWLEKPKKSSADGIDSPDRIRPCLPRNPGQSLLYCAYRHVRVRS